MTLGFESCHKTLVGVSTEIFKDYYEPLYIYECLNKIKNMYIKKISIKDGNRYENFNVKINTKISN